MIRQFTIHINQRIYLKTVLSDTKKIGSINHGHQNKIKINI